MNQEQLDGINERLDAVVACLQAIRNPVQVETGLHRKEVEEKWIAIRNNAGALWQWSANNLPIPEFNAIGGRFYSFRWNIKEDDEGKEIKYLMLGMQTPSGEKYMIRSQLQSNFSFQLLMAIGSLPLTSIHDTFEIVLYGNDTTKVNPSSEKGKNYLPTVFCKVFHEGREIKYTYNKELREDITYLVGLVESLGSNFADKSSKEPSSSEEEWDDTPISQAKPIPESPATAILKVAPAPSPTIPISDLTLQSNIELKRLGIDAESGRNLLLKRYGKRSRVVLSDEEFVDFVDYLKAQEI